MSGPLAGVRVIEFAGLGPTPFTALMLTSMGAEVLRIERSGAVEDAPGDVRFDFLREGRPAISLDLKTKSGKGIVRDLIGSADILLEGFRPGVMERLELGPELLLAERPSLIYARMTGWGQTGPLSQKAGHDINYIAITGGLHMIGDADRPPCPPINFIGDYGGGAMFALTGILAALVERQSSGRGQIIDAAMTDGTAMLMTQIFAWSAMGFWQPERGTNLLDGSAYFYRCYEASDGAYVAVGALELRFHDELLRGLGLHPDDFPDRLNRVNWAERADLLAKTFRTASRDEWVRRFEPFDACVTPVLTLDEAVHHPANVAREAHHMGHLGPQPAFAPRMSRTPSAVDRTGDGARVNPEPRLAAWGVDQATIDALRAPKQVEPGG